MKIRTRIFLGILLVVGVGLVYLVDWVVDDLTPRYREATEEPLVDAARILAAIAAATASTTGALDVALFRAAFRDVSSHLFEAQIYGLTKTSVDFRIYITDATGVVIFDSDGGRDEGKDYSNWRDVYLTLRGTYGARTSRDLPRHPHAGVLYVAAPILVGGQTVGVLTVGKPTGNSEVFIAHAKRKIVMGGTTSGLAILVVGLVMSNMVTRPVRKLTAYVNAVRDGTRIPPPRLGTSEIGQLGTAFETMRAALDGKQYIENYVHTLTHEIKSPLSAIQGAAELLQEEMPAERRTRFLENIGAETHRIATIVEKLLLLSSLENRTNPQEIAVVRLWDVVQEIYQSVFPMIEAKEITFMQTGEATAALQGEYTLIRQAIENLLQNAIEFTPCRGKITVHVGKTSTHVELVVKDSGPGIPAYAVERVFERFYSLSRPDTGKKSSGLGLSVVQQVALLHQGKITVDNAPEGGVEARLVFPQSFDSPGGKKREV